MNHKHGSASRSLHSPSSDNSTTEHSENSKKPVKQGRYGEPSDPHNPAERQNKAIERVQEQNQAPHMQARESQPTSYESSSDRHPWHKGGRKKTIEHRLKALKDRVCNRHSKAVRGCPDCGDFAKLFEKRFDGKEELDEKRERQRAYFEKWRQKSKMQDRLTAYCLPEEKVQILMACEALELSMRDFIVSACLEASKFVLDLKKGDRRARVLRDEQRTHKRK